MNIRKAVRGAAGRAEEVPARNWLSSQKQRATKLWARSTNLLGLSASSMARVFAGVGARTTRRTAGTGSNLAPFTMAGFPASLLPGASGRAGVSALRSAVPKPTPVNLRRFAETPIARRAINVIKDRISGMRWRIQVRNGRSLEQIPDGAARIRQLTENFEAPNPDDSFRSLLEQVLEDVIVGGFGAIDREKQ